VDEAALKRLGARGLIRPSDKALQIVLGPIADQVAGEIRAELGRPSAPHRMEQLVAAMGGRGNLVRVTARASRLLLDVKDPAKVVEAQISDGVRGLVKTASHRWQVIVGPEAEAWAQQFPA
jgi:N-acetylglucosamine PTS system EIICBA or EIICB component